MFARGVKRLEATLLAFEKTQRSLATAIEEIDVDAKTKATEISKMNADYAALMRNKEKAERILGNINKFFA